MSATSVMVLLTGANEGSTPLEVAAASNDPHIDITVVDFFVAGERTRGVDVISLSANSKYDWRAYSRLLNLLRRHRPDVLHVHPNAVGAIARLLGVLTNIPCLVTTEHSTHTDFGIVRNLVNGGTNWLNDVIVANSSATADSFKQWEKILQSASNTETTVIHYGVNIKEIQGAPYPCDIQLPSGFKICWTGRLTDGKNLSSLLRAVSILRNDNIDIELVLAGDGPMRAELEALARRLGIESSVTFLGWISERKNVYTVISKTDIFSFPSVYEGFGMSNVEAMATGTPVIVNDIPVLREVVGDAGLFVDATEPRQLADAIRELYDNPELRERLGEKARKRARTHFPLAKTVKEYNEVYRSCNDT
jgi:glycosyltransferase involved in cell wall biosynthesis